MATQSCPNCQRSHDVAVYVTGQRVLCACGIKFEVRRSDVSSARTMNLRPARSGGPHPLPLGEGQGEGANRHPLPLGEGQGEGAAHTAPATPATHEAATASGPSTTGSSAADLGIEVTFRPPSRAARNDLAPNEAVPPPANGAAPANEPSSPTRLSVPGVDIPGYDLTVLLGRGGMGEVWRAEQKSLGRTVAVKLLPTDLARDTEFVARFRKEAAALAALSHPHIIQIIDRGDVGGEHYYFVMEFVEGRSLREVMSARRPSPQESLRIVLQILRAMEAAHEKHIIHRDLKPENILLDARGHVKVADFGLAGMRGAVDEHRHQLTATSVAMGTLNYMAPEQRRDARAVDGRADLYSVGVILYELLTAELPIGRFRMPSVRTPGVDARFDDVVGKLLEAEPEQRYANATEVIAALEPLQTGTSISAAGNGSQPRMAPPASQVTTAPVAPGTIIERGFRGLRNGLVVVAALAVIAIGARTLFGQENATGNGQGGATIPAVARPKNSENTYAELFGASVETPAASKDERDSLSVTFEEGDEEINVHTGEWRIEAGKLIALQAGNETGGEKLVPRAYIAKRYYSTDDFDVQVKVAYKDIRDRYDVGDDVQRFAELAMRIKDLQVSVFAIPGGGMRLAWRYFTPDGVERADNSARDLEMMVTDELPAPADGKAFTMRLTLQRVKDAVKVTAYLNDKEFARKLLPGLQGQIGKVAVGCRNYECAFDDLIVQGRPRARPTRKAAAGGE